MAELAPLPVRRIVICLSWSYIYSPLPERTDWRNHKVERVLTNSSFVGDFVAWAMGLPVHRFQWGMDPKLYYHPSEEKIPQITYVARKQGAIRELRQALWSRNPEFLDRIAWLGLEGQTEADYARAVRRSSIFLNLSPAEGLPCAALEAMRSGTLVAGFNSVGGQRELIGSGEKQNCILAENQDYLTLARQLESPLVDLLAGNMSRWSGIRDNALAASAAYTREAEEASVVSLWRTLIG
jgi:glycosyltransferase involved in cell wall biosynthesis